jgi:predicted ribosomally synthesized peptide with nif11-like leader
MSVEDVKRFYDALAKDESLQGKFKALVKKHEGQKPNEAECDALFENEFLPFAKEVGYDFTLEELKEYGQGIKPVSHQLSEDELATVAGGRTFCILWGASDDLISCSCAGYGHGIDHGQWCVCVLGGGGQ